MNKEKQIEEMAEILKAYTKKNHIMASHVILDAYAEELYKAGFSKQEWISVEERLPEIRQRVLLYSYHDGVNTGYRADEIGRFYVDKSYPYRPTHWMPLPEAPKMKGGAE